MSDKLIPLEHPGTILKEEFMVPFEKEVLLHGLLFVCQNISAYLRGIFHAYNCNMTLI